MLCVIGCEFVFHQVCHTQSELVLRSRRSLDRFVSLLGAFVYMVRFGLAGQPMRRLFLALLVVVPSGCSVGPIIEPQNSPPNIELYGISVADVVSWAREDQHQHHQQDLDGVEVWCGRFTLGRAGIASGETWVGFDNTNKMLPDECTQKQRQAVVVIDLFLRQGVMALFKALRRLKKSALAWFAPICSSFVFANSSRTLRFSLPEGDLTYEPVVIGNHMAELAMLAMVYCVHRSIRCITEQPIDSRFFVYTPAEATIAWLKFLFGCHDGFLKVEHCGFLPVDMRKPAKKFLLWCWPVNWIISIETPRCICNPDVHIKLMFVNKKGGICGNKKEMKKSEGYADAFRAAVVQCHRLGSFKLPGHCKRATPPSFPSHWADQDSASSGDDFPAPPSCKRQRNSCEEVVVSSSMPDWADQDSDSD